MSSTSFCVTPHASAGAGGRSDLLRSIHARSTAAAAHPLTPVDASPSRASPANSGSSPRDSQASVTSTDSSSSSSARVSVARDATAAAAMIELSQQVGARCRLEMLQVSCENLLGQLAHGVDWKSWKSPGIRWVGQLAHGVDLEILEIL